MTENQADVIIQELKGIRLLLRMILVSGLLLYGAHLLHTLVWHR
jgi:hypothetical protein